MFDGIFMEKLTLIQSEVLGKANIPDDLFSGDIGLTIFSTGGDRDVWQENLLHMDTLAASSDVRIHCSLNVADFICRSCPNLVRGLIYRPERLRASVWSSLIDARFLLNRGAVILPFGVMSDRSDQIQRLFGSSLFIRPDSARKLFTGFRLKTDHLQAELKILQRSYGLQHDDLILIDEGRSLHCVECRFWVSQGQIVTWAPYALAEGGVPDPDRIDPGQIDAMREVLEAILRETPSLETLDDMLVMDMAIEMIGGSARLIEINTWATSGFYPGADLAAIFNEQRMMEEK